MELSGLYIKGTGNYVVKEIAPPVESGLLLPNNVNFVDTDNNGTPDQWNLNGATTSTVINGIWRMAYLSFNYYGLSGAGIHPVTIGRTYRLRMKCRGSGGPMRLLSGVTFILPNSTPDWSVVEKYFAPTAVSWYVTANNAASGYFELEWITLEEVSEGYPLLDKGSKYLECTASGTVAFPSKQAYGTWEFDLYKGADANNLNVALISNKILGYPNINGYWFLAYSDERLYIMKTSSPTGSTVMRTTTAYFKINTWYRVKITRTLSGEFTLYIKGESFGSDYFLVDSLDLGTNPATDTTYTTSEYFIMDLDTGDRIANIIMREGVQE